MSGGLPDVNLLQPRASVRVVWPRRGVGAVLKEELMFASAELEVKAKGSAALQRYLMELHGEGQWVVHLD